MTATVDHTPYIVYVGDTVERLSTAFNEFGKAIQNATMCFVKAVEDFMDFFEYTPLEDPIECAPVIGSPVAGASHSRLHRSRLYAPG